MKINAKKEGYDGLTGLGREKSCKIIDVKQQKFEEKPLPSRREKEKFEKLLKSEFEQVKLSFQQT